MQRHEYHHNTAEQVKGYLDEALRIVTELDPPADLVGIAFAKAIDMLGAKQIVMEQAQMVPDLNRLIPGR
jgi:hypothetical protein